ncbi:MAG: hypothetical protein SVK08_00440 [Halobacteriota archaeon]|nr:hypothetical protein [Halobacteriota archaeon]
MSISKINGQDISTIAKIFGVNVSTIAKVNGIEVGAGPSVDYDFKIIYGTAVIASGNTTVTITEGTDYNLETGIDSSSALIRITNTRLTGMGRTSGGATVTPNNFTAWITNGGNIGTSITFQRAGTTGDTRIDYMIVQYIGTSGGPNEIKFRSCGTISLGSTDLSLDSSSVNYSTANILEPYKCMPILTGQATADSGTQWATGLHYLIWNWGATSFAVTAVRGLTGDASYVSFAVVEFTGSNWGAVKGKLISATMTSTWIPGGADGYNDFSIAETGNDVSFSQGVADITKSLLHNQMRATDNPTGLDDAGRQVLWKDVDEVRIRSRETAAGKYHQLYFVEHIGTGTGAMAIQNLSIVDDNINLGTEERQWTQSITDVGSVSNAMLFGETASVDGGGTAYPRGSINMRITGTTELTLTECDDGQERRIGVQVVQMPYCDSAAPSEPTTYDEVDAHYERTSYQGVSSLESNLSFRKKEFTSTSDEHWFKLIIPTIESYYNIADTLPILIGLNAVPIQVNIEVYSGNMAKIWEKTQYSADQTWSYTDFLYSNNTANQSNLLANDDQVFWVKITPYSSSDLNKEYLCFWGFTDAQISVINITSTGTTVWSYDFYCNSFYQAKWLILNVTPTNLRSWSYYHNYDGTTYAARDYVAYDMSNYSAGVATPDDSYTTTSGQYRTIVLTLGDHSNPLGAGTWLIGTSVNSGNTGNVDGRFQLYWS